MWAAFFFVLNLFDCFFTLAAVHRWGVKIELNPLMRMCMQHSDGLFIGVKLVVGIVCSYLMLRVAMPAKLNKVGLAVCSLYFLISISNLVCWYVNSLPTK